MSQWVARVSPDDIAVGVVERKLRAFNEAAVGPYAYEPLALALRDSAGAVGGGFLGYAGLGWLNVATLWVDEALRGRGHGRALMEAGEALALELGCAHAFLFTYSFQTPDFYRALGYREFAALEDFPPGARRLFFRKDLGTDTGAQRSSAGEQADAGYEAGASDGATQLIRSVSQLLAPRT